MSLPAAVSSRLAALFGLLLLASAAPAWAQQGGARPPTNLVATALDRQIVLNFTRNNNPANGCNSLWYSTNAADAAPRFVLLIAGNEGRLASRISLTTQSDQADAASGTPLVNGTAYSVAIRYFGDGGLVCGQSNPVSATVTATPTLRPQPADMVADLVLGQADFAGESRNRGGAAAANTLNFAGGIAIDRSVTPNRVYVADAGNNRVLAYSDMPALTNGAAAIAVFGQNGSFTTTAAGTSETTLREPEGVAVDATGNLYVADTKNHRVLRFNRPFAGEAVDTTADRIWGQMFFSTMTAGTSNTTLNNPVAVTLDSAGRLYVAETVNNRVLRFNGATDEVPDATADAVFGKPDFTTSNVVGVSAKNINGAAGVAVDVADNLYVTDRGGHRVLRFANASTATTDPSAAGVFGQSDFTSGTSGTGNQFTSPSGLAIDDNGALYVADSGNNRALRFDLPSAVTSGTVPTAAAEFGGSTTANDRKVTSAGAVALDGNGHLYVSSPHRMVRFNVAAPANGVCATNVAASSTAPNAGLCTTGTATTVSSTGGSWKWGCNGTGGGTSTAANACSSLFQTQTITLNANPTSMVVNGTSTVEATSTSLLKPDLTSTTAAFCTLAPAAGNPLGSTVTATGTTAGTCTVKANVPVSADGCTSCFQAATEQTVNILINAPFIPSAGIPPSPPAAAPSSVSGSAGDGQVTVSFQPAGGDVSNYQYSLDGGQTFQNFSPIVTTSPATISGLSNGTLYSVVLRAINNGGFGPASPPVSLMPLADNDTDGISSSAEDNVPGATTVTGDGNGDGVKDSTQAFVTSLADANGLYTTLVSGSGKPLRQVVAVSKPSDFPSDAGSVFSGTAFTVTGLNAGATEVFELYLDSSRGTVTGLRKKNLRTGQWDTIPATISTVGSKTKIVYSLTDGGDYDSDRSLNGSLSDPVFVVGTAGAPAAAGGGGGGSFGWLTLIPLAGAALRRRKRH